MRHCPSFTMVCLLICLLVSACGATSTGGPQTWIDRPLDNTTAPLGPIVVMVHASDADGVASIEFSVNGQWITSIPAGGGRMETRTYEWQPSGPGTYEIQVWAVDMSGNVGATATSVVTIPGMITATPEEEEVVAETPKAATDTPQPTLTATATTKATAVPTATPEPTNTPKPTKTPTPPPPSPTMDLSPPSITAKYFSPSDYMVGGSPSGCDARRTGTSVIIANDPGGIWSVWADWAAGSQSGTVYYTLIEYQTYFGEFGPFSGEGWLYINGRVNDNFGNYQPFTQVIEVKSCVD